MRRGRSTVVGVDPGRGGRGRRRRRVPRARRRSRPGSGSGGARSSSATPPSGSSPAARRGEPASVPDVVFARFDALAVVDDRGAVTVRGDGPGRARLDHAVADVRAGRTTVSQCPPPIATGGWRTGLDRDDVLRPRRDDPRAAARRRVLPGEPHPPAHLRTRRSTRSRSTRPLAHTHPAPHPSLLRLPSVGRGHRGRVGVARALPASARSASRDATDQGHRRDPRRAAGQRQGPRRERDDRRPRPQRPRSRAASPGRSRCPRCARSSRIPGCTTS